MTPPEALDHIARAQTMPLDQINVSDPKLYQQDVWQPYFRRLRRDAPVHYCKDSPVGPFWSVTKYKDIVETEVNHDTYSSSSTYGGVILRDLPSEFSVPTFIAMDPPRHNDQRKVVQPIVSHENCEFRGPHPMSRHQDPRRPAAG